METRHLAINRRMESLGKILVDELDPYMEFVVLIAHVEAFGISMRYRLPHGFIALLK